MDDATKDQAYFVVRLIAAIETGNHDLAEQIRKEATAAGYEVSTSYLAQV